MRWGEELAHQVYGEPDAQFEALAHEVSTRSQQAHRRRHLAEQQLLVENLLHVLVAVKVAAAIGHHKVQHLPASHISHQLLQSPHVVNECC